MIEITVPVQVQKSSACFKPITQNTSKKAATNTLIQSCIHLKTPPILFFTKNKKAWEITVKQFLPGFYPSVTQQSCEFSLGPDQH